MRIKTNHILILLSGILFFALYLVLALNNRMPYEDFNFISRTKDVGAINAMIYIYEVYSARWSAHTLAFSFSMLYDKRYFLFTFNILTLFTLFASIFQLLKKVLGEFHIPKITLISFTALFTICLFFSSYSIGEMWFWYMVNWMYMWSLIAWNFLLLILLSQKIKSVHIASLVVLAAYIAGAAESYAMTCIFFLLALLVFKKKKNLPSVIRQIETKPLILSLLLLSSFYMITLFAPGTWMRKERLTDATFIQHIIMVFKGYGIVILRYSPKLIPYLLLFGLPWMVLGKEYESKEKKDIKMLLPAFIKSLVLLGALIFALIVPASWILYDPPPARALSQVSFLLVSYFSFIFFYMGYKTSISKKIAGGISAAALIVGMVVIFVHLVDQNSVTETFSKGYDNRLGEIREQTQAGRTETLYFESLPESGMLYSDELSADSTHNNYFENIYSPAFHVAAK